VTSYHRFSYAQHHTQSASSTRLGRCRHFYSSKAPYVSSRAVS
jgi:hypothetical protein